MPEQVLSTEQILAIDKAHIWHPYASSVDAPAVYPVVSAQGERLTLADGRELLDGMSSWWSVIHGYNNPVINAAAKAQIDQMSHVMFGGITHPPAAKLAKLLVDISPEPLDRVFFSDSGSVAVEVAIKMALQYWYSIGKPEKHQLLTVKNGYHGDTFGAMATCDPVTGMHHLFQPVMPTHLFAESPAIKFGEEFDDSDIASLKALLENNHQQLAAVIIEPVVQGTGGMNFYSPGYVTKLRALCDEFDVLLIADEIATGFGRTGKLFACEHAGISPDIMCLGKTMTGGYISMAATLCTDKISRGISEGEAGAFMHGPTFMANPLACAISYASIDLLLQQDWQSVVSNMQQQLTEGLQLATALPGVADVRVLGSIGVIEMEQAVDMAYVQKALVDEGIWLRPFGKLIYTIPPYTMTTEDLKVLSSSMVNVVQKMAV